MTSNHKTIAVINDGTRERSARADSGPSIIVTTNADATGNRIGRARLKATINRMTNIPMVADCAAVRQICATSATGLGSLTESAKRASWPSSVLGSRRCPPLVLLASMALITGEVPFGCPRPLQPGAVASPLLNLPLSGAAQVEPVSFVPPWHSGWQPRSEERRVGK